MNTNINIRTDSSIKQQAEYLFNDLGLTMSTAINIFLRQAVKEHRIPFEIRKVDFNETTIKAIEDTKKALENNELKSFTNVDDLMRDLLND